MVFGRTFWEQRQIWVSEPYFVEVRGVGRHWLMTRWKTNGQLSVALIEVFSLYITVPELQSKMCTARLFLHIRSTFCTQISPGQGRRKTRDTGVLDGEDRIPVRSLVLTQYLSVMDVQTDRQP